MLDEVEGVVVLISIHALREEGDLVGLRVHRGGQISIHALREEGDAQPKFDKLSTDIFLSTPSARRATKRACRSLLKKSNFYPRPPRGGRPSMILYQKSGMHFYPRPPRGGRHKVAPHVFLAVHISIHALREEGDAAQVAGKSLRVLFLSTPSARRATLASLPLLQIQTYFYPRPPRGGRQAI